jgi:AICAR transformylase/IMP cyclohydrolase PurH
MQLNPKDLPMEEKESEVYKDDQPLDEKLFDKTVNYDKVIEQFLCSVNDSDDEEEEPIDNTQD